MLPKPNAIKALMTKSLINSKKHNIKTDKVVKLLIAK